MNSFYLSHRLLKLAFLTLFVLLLGSCEKRPHIEIMYLSNDGISVDDINTLKSIDGKIRKLKNRQGREAPITSQIIRALENHQGASFELKVDSTYRDYYKSLVSNLDEQINHLELLSTDLHKNQLEIDRLSYKILDNLSSIEKISCGNSCKDFFSSNFVFDNFFGGGAFAVALTTYIVALMAVCGLVMQVVITANTKKRVSDTVNDFEHLSYLTRAEVDMRADIFYCINLFNNIIYDYRIAKSEVNVFPFNLEQLKITSQYLDKIQEKIILADKDFAIITGSTKDLNEKIAAKEKRIRNLNELEKRYLFFKVNFFSSAAFFNSYYLLYLAESNKLKLPWDKSTIDLLKNIVDNCKKALELINEDKESGERMRNDWYDSCLKSLFIVFSLGYDDEKLKNTYKKKNLEFKRYMKKNQEFSDDVWPEWQSVAKRLNVTIYKPT